MDKNTFESIKTSSTQNTNEYYSNQLNANTLLLNLFYK